MNNRDNPESAASASAASSSASASASSSKPKECELKAGYLPSTICMISLEPFKQPVIAADGHTYEEAAFKDWVRQSPKRPLVNSPATLQPLASNHVQPNYVVKKLMDEYELAIIPRLAALKRYEERAAASSAAPASASSSAASSSAASASAPSIQALAPGQSQIASAQDEPRLAQLTKQLQDLSERESLVTEQLHATLDAYEELKASSSEKANADAQQLNLATVRNRELGVQLDQAHRRNVELNGQLHLAQDRIRAREQALSIAEAAKASLGSSLESHKQLLVRYEQRNIATVNEYQNLRAVYQQACQDANQKQELMVRDKDAQIAALTQQLAQVQKKAVTLPPQPRSTVVNAQRFFAPGANRPLDADLCKRLWNAINRGFVSALKTMLPLANIRAYLNHAYDADGKTPLMRLIENFNYFPTSAKIMLEDICKLADLNIPDRRGNTALHYAAKLNIGWVLNYLVCKGANPLAENLAGEKPSAVLTKQPHYDSLNLTKLMTAERRANHHLARQELEFYVPSPQQPSISHRR